MSGLPSLLAEGLPSTMSWGISDHKFQCLANLQPGMLKDSRTTCLKAITQFNSLVILLHAARKLQSKLHPYPAFKLMVSSET